MFSASSVASRICLFIFQLPATIGFLTDNTPLNRRSPSDYLVLLVGQRHYPRQILSFEEFKTGAAASADDQPLLLAKVSANPALHDAEGGLAVFCEDFGDALTEVGLDLGVHVDEGAVDPFGQQAPDGRLSRAPFARDDENT